MVKKHNSKKEVKKSIKSTKTRSHIKGGLKQKDPFLTSWQAVFKMIDSPGAILTPLAHTSLKGFIFRLDILHEEQHTEFYDLNPQGTAYTTPVYSLVFKFAIISDSLDEDLSNLVITGDVDDIGRQIERNKETEDLNSFMEEAAIQQDIYTKTLSPCGNPITLSVVDFSYFDTSSSVRLMDKLKTINNSSEPGQMQKVGEMLSYLERNVQQRGDSGIPRRLGLITMELAKSEFKELNKIEYIKAYNAEYIKAYNADCNYALAQILVLFIKLKKMNYDCHNGNVMASTIDPDTEGGGTKKRAVLIDFGRTLNFNNRNPFPRHMAAIIGRYNSILGRGRDRYRTDLAEIMTYSVTDFYISRENSEEKVIERMEKIIKFMAFIDYFTNTTYFDMSSMNRPQLISFLRYIWSIL